ncbi:D-aminoacyl-tRNA deacylase [uncultured Bilophila sp.]|mgnify:CR=1 FL=1|nr:D-aminoacyl-tRNA deacylase [uncultured Bilophila sp.]
MRLLIQRVKEGHVDVAGKTVASIGKGLVVLAGFGAQDTPDLPGTRLWDAMIEKMLRLRIFPDEEGRMNRELTDIGGEIILVSQFTLYADVRKGRRPSFHLSAAPSVAEPLFRRLVSDVEARLPGRVREGVFAADMDVSLVNWGPVTIMLDSESLGQPANPSTL